MHRTSVLSAHTHCPARSTRKRSPAYPAFDGYVSGRARRAVWVAALLAAPVLPGATLSCGARETNMSTKTGNPPVIDQTRVRIVGADGEVVVSGDEGAVQTSGDEQIVAKVTNRSNDATASTAVNDDGSFEVHIEGTLDDDYELTLTTRGTGDSTTIELGENDEGTATCLERTGMTPSEGNTRGPQPICGTLQAEALCQAAELVATVPSLCEADGDCIVARGIPECADSYGSGAVVSKKGAAELSAGLASIDETICRDFEVEGCTYYASGGPPLPETVALCEAGRCVAGFVQYAFECSNAVLIDETPTCEDYETEARCERDQMLANLINECTRDDDCTAFYEMPDCTTRDCSGGTVIAASSEGDANAGLAAINAGICSGVTEGACEYGGPPCSSLELNPRCVAGACVHVPTE